MNATVNIADEFLASPRGEFPNGDVIQVNDAIALNTQRAGIDAALAQGRPVEIDWDHESVEKESYRPLGHVVEARLTNAGLVVKANYTAHGVDTLRLGGARLVSPAYDQMEHLGGKRYRPINIHSIGVVKAANMKTLPPILNRSGVTTRVVLLNRELPFVSARQRITNREAADLFSAVVREHQRESGRTFTDSWNFARDRFPLLNCLMRLPNTSEGVLLNRSVSPFKSSTDAEQAKYWSAIEKAAAAVRERIATPTRLYRHDSDSGDAPFWSVWDEASAATGGDRRRAFDWIRDHYPEVFGNFVLNAPEAAQFL